MSEMKAFNPKVLIGKAVAPCDIFTELPGGKLIRICESGNLINQELIDKCLNDRTVKLHMRISDYKEHFFDEEIVPISSTSEVGLQASSIKIVRGSMHSFGMPDKIINLVDKTVDSTINTITKRPNIRQLLQNIVLKGSFFEKKSLMMCYMSIFALSNHKDCSKKKVEALGMACLLHDFELESERYLKKEITKANIVELRINEDEMITNLETHAEKEASILRKSSEISSEVVRLVMHHHDTLISDSALFTPSERSLPLLNQIFNISHEFAVYLILYGADRHNFTDFYYRLEERLLPQYKKTLNLFCELI